ncbi:MAG: IclR family transcriptional regulator [Microbacteriaceae bacterium]
MPPQNKTKSDAPQGAAASLLNGLSVLEAFSIETPVLSVTEISRRVQLHKSTVSRILNGLAKAGYVQREESSGRFRLGLGLIALSGPLLADLNVRVAALPHLADLTEVTGETSALTVWNGNESVVVEQVPSPHQVKHTASIGTRYDKYESSSVRVFLAELPEHLAAELLSSNRVVRGRHGDIETNFVEHLRSVRECGFAINDGYTTPEEFGVSAAVRDYRDFVVGCVTASAPHSRVSKEVAKNLAEAVVATAARISARLGHTNVALTASS